MSEISYELIPLLLRLSAMDTFLATADEQNASTLGGAKASQTRNHGG